MGVLIVIDRIENGIAACEIDGSVMKMLPLSVLPPDVREGDILRQTGEGYRVDAEETARRREYNAEMMRRLMRRRGASDEEGGASRGASEDE